MALPDNYEGGGLESLKNSLDFERHRIAEWREFHSATGRWPVVSILFHYIVLVALLTTVFAVCYLLDRDIWGWSKALMVGGSSLVVLALLWVGGEEAIYKFEKSRHPRSDSR
jgi:hypothetical protein